MSQDAEDQNQGQDPFHIGNLIRIHSKVHGYTKGRVIYRNAELVRIMPDEASDRAVEFPMEEDGAVFSPTLGVTEVNIFSEQESPFYVDFLGARPGEMLEFFTADGTQAAAAGEVAEVLKDDTEGAEQDAIRLTDGRVMDFNGVGPEAPIVVIRVRTSIDATATEAEATGEATAEPDATAIQRQRDIADLLMSVLPAATVEIIPTVERTYPDSMQREGLFEDLMADVKKPTERKIRAIEREVDLALALKNKSILRDQADRILGTTPYSLTTVRDVVAQGSAVPAAIPIVAGARVLNLDTADTATYSFKDTDVLPRALGTIELESEDAANRYLNGTQPEGTTNKFYSYTYDLLGRGLATLHGPDTGERWSEDQDVIRTAAPETAVQGLSAKLPRPDDKEAPPVSLAFLLSNVKDRGVRVLTADQHRHLKTGVTHISAPSDTAHVTGYIILPPKAALSLRPPRNPRHLPTALLYSAAGEADNLPTIAATLQSLYSSESGSPQNAWTLAADAASDVQVAEWLQSVLRYTVHPIDSLGPRGPHLLSLLDTLGVGSTDLAPPVADVINAWVAKSQETWVSLLKARRAEIQALLDTEEPRTFQSVVGIDSPLWAALRIAEPLKELLEDIERRNPTIAGAPTAMTASLLVEAQGDATPLIWSEIAKLDSRELAGVDTVSATLSLAASRAYTLRRAALRSKDLIAMHAEPERNPCPHANRLESIRNIADVVERSQLLRAFIEEFQGPKSGDWITCVLCTKTCVCYHELMELEALAQPARLDAIQKQMLIRFGGERYEGKIVCKNCGQALQDIDYDEHVEFDDDGRPIQQASVLTEDQLAEDGDPASAISAITHFESQSHREIAEALTDLLMHARLTMPPDVFRRIVNYTEIYVGRRAPDEKAYTAHTERLAKSASTKLKKATGVSGVVADIPTYSETIDRLRVSALIALTTIAIQTEPVSLGTALPRCAFSRNGFPLNSDEGPEKSGVVMYMVCVAADIVTETKYRRTPWTSQLWIGDTKAESRQRKALAFVIPAFNVILGISSEKDKKSVSLSFTPEINMQLTKARADTGAARERDLVSLTDELPTGFRPEPRPPNITKPVVEHMPNIAAVGELRTALHKQAIATIATLHNNVTETRDSMCCPKRVTDFEGSESRIHPALLTAATKARQMNIAAVNAGSHLWPMFEAPHAVPIEQDVDEGVLFKLFLKFCYTGAAVGQPHEFSVGNICRQCGLSLGTSVDFIDFSKEGAGILAAQQGPLRIEVTRVAFDALSDATRRRKLLRATAPMAGAADKSGLGILLAACKRIPAMVQITEILTEILTQPVAKDEFGRIEQWSSLSGYIDELILAAGIETAMLDKMTEDPFIEGPRALQEYWCAKAYAAGAGYAVTTMDQTNWYAFSDEHREIINKMLGENATWFPNTVTDRMKPYLTKIGQTLGPLLNVWITSVRPDPSRWNLVEAQLVLRSLVVQVWHDALLSDSWMYSTGLVSTEREAIVADVRGWTLALMDYKRGSDDVGHKRGHVQKQYLKFSTEEIKRVLQQRAELERTSVVEEFENIKDDDLRAAELIKKQFRIGRWNVGKNLQKYDPELFEFEHEQRRRMGVLMEGDAPGQALGQAPGSGSAPVPNPLVQQEEGYSVEQGADGDDY